MSQTSNVSNLAERCIHLSAGCCVDPDLVAKWGMNLSKLKKLAEAYRAGWLHNVMGRITPLTLRSRNDYVAMADLFIEGTAEAMALLDRFEADMEEFCASAGLELTEHMTMETVSSELRAHARLYQQINLLFMQKFGVERRDPVQRLATNPIMNGETNPFVKEFMAARSA